MCDASEIITFGAADPLNLTASVGDVRADATYDDALPESGIKGQSLYMGDSDNGVNAFDHMTVNIQNDGLLL